MLNISKKILFSALIGCQTKHKNPIITIYFPPPSDQHIQRMVNAMAPITVLLIAIAVPMATAFTQPRTTCVHSARSSTANIGNGNSCSVLRTKNDVSRRSPSSLSASTTSNVFSPLTWFAPKEKENNNDEAILDVKSQIASAM